MASYKIQLKDENGNRQYPVSTTNIVVDANGVSVADLLDRKQPTLVSGVNIKTINGKTLLGEGDLVIEGGSGDGSASVETRVLYAYPNGEEIPNEEKLYNQETYTKIVNGEIIQLAEPILSTPVEHAFIDGVVAFTIVGGLQGTSQKDALICFNGSLTQDGNAFYNEYQVTDGGSSGEAAESDVISVVYDDDTTIPSNVEAFNKLAECCNSVGKPVAVMVCIESGYRWGIEHFYWDIVGERIELVSPVRKDGMYATFYLTKDGSCTATFGQVSLGGDDPNNAKMFALNSPFFGAGGELVTLDYARTALDTDFDFEIPQEIKDWWYNYVTGLIDENIATMTQIEESLNNGEKVLIVIKTRSIVEFILALYLWSVGEGGSIDATTEEIVELLEMSKVIQEYAYPKAYEISPPVDGEPLVINVTGDTLGLSIDASGDWTKNGTVVKTTYNLFYEAGARLDKERCDANLIAMNRPLNYTDISVCEFMTSNGTYSTRDVLIISRKEKTVDNFTDLDGSVNTREVASFYYLDGTNMYELQVSKYDGYCRRVSLGEVKFGNDSAGGLQFFVERYVYMGETEEERTYNLESLAMAGQGADILWAGVNNAPIGDTVGSWYARREYDLFVAEAHAYIDSESGILVMENTSFCRNLIYGSYDVGYDDEREWLVAFFKRDNWLYERAFYGDFPIISWSEESNTVLRAYYLANGFAIAYVSVNIETGEVSQPMVGQ